MTNLPLSNDPFTQTALAGVPLGAGFRLDSDVRVVRVELYFLPVHTRVPLKFGSETLTSVSCARVAVTVENKSGKRAVGWGETPLSVQWVWPSDLPYAERFDAMRNFCIRLAERWAGFRLAGHPFEIGHSFQHQVLLKEMASADPSDHATPQLPLLAALLCCSPFDIALYDAFGRLHNRSAWSMLGEEFLSYDLSHYLTGVEDSGAEFQGRYPGDFLVSPRADSLLAWHLVGGLDPISKSELTGREPEDGHPVLLSEWIQRDGLQCLKVKLRGSDAAWDYDRLVRVGRVAEAHGAKYLTADFNCTVTDPAYVIDVLDRLAADEPSIYENILYIEQPFPYDIEARRIDVRRVSQRKPLLMDESAHHWRLVEVGRSLGWTGVALKTCKTLTGALLSHCWAKHHGMHIMVQDLTNPMLAQVSHLSLAAHVDTMLGVETNSMQFYPGASDLEAHVHPGVYRRIRGRVDLSTVRGPGLGYRVDEIGRRLPAAAAVFG